MKLIKKIKKKTLINILIRMTYELEHIRTLGNFDLIIREMIFTFF